MDTKKKARLMTMLAASVLSMGAAQADITAGMVRSLAGPASGLGIPAKNAMAVWPKTVAGTKLNVIMIEVADGPFKVVP